MQKGVSIADAMNNLSIVVGSTWSRASYDLVSFYKVYVQAAPEFRRYPSDFDNCLSRTIKEKWCPTPPYVTQETTGIE